MSVKSRHEEIDTLIYNQKEVNNLPHHSNFTILIGVLVTRIYIIFWLLRNQGKSYHFAAVNKWSRHGWFVSENIKGLCIIFSFDQASVGQQNNRHLIYEQLKRCKNKGVCGEVRIIHNNCKNSRLPVVGINLNTFT